MNQPYTSNYDTYGDNTGQDTLLNGQTGVSLDTDISASSNSTEEDSGGVEFVFNYADNVPQEIKDSMKEAGEVWSSMISDDVTVKIDVGFEPLEKTEDDRSIKGRANSNFIEVSYAEYRQALAENATSNDDATAIANLPEEESIDLLINNTEENKGSDEAYLDDNNSRNNSTVLLTNANAKALGFDVEDRIDASIDFNSNLNWDFNSNDGIDKDAIDFQGVAEHEIGHTLGFKSGINGLDTTASQNLGEEIASGDVDLEDVVEVLGLEDLVDEFGLEDEVTNADLEELIAGSPIEPLLENIPIDSFVSENDYAPYSQDLFRYSDSSSDLGVIDFTADEDNKYFSIDGGHTKIAAFSTGENLGDGRQASHWKDNQGIGIMDPTIDRGEAIDITSTDLQLIDVIGWNLNN